MKRNEKIVSIGVKIVPILQKSRISVQFLHCITIATAPIILQSSSVPKSVMLHIKVGGTPIKKKKKSGVTALDQLFMI